MLGATETTKYPDVDPAGIVMTIEVALHELTVTGTSFNSTSPAFPNPEPEIAIWLPIEPVVADTLVIAGAGVDSELTETLSKVPVPRVDVIWLLTAIPMYTSVAIEIVWLDPI